MPGINFLDNKKGDDGQRPKDKDDRKEKSAWSQPEKEIRGSKGSAFSFLPFINKKAPADKSAASAIDKSKIKESREEILNLIRRHEDSKIPLKEKNKNFLAALGEKLKKRPGHKEVLIDYQRVFNREKEHKSQIGRIFNIKPAAESGPARPAAVKPKNNRLSELIRTLKSKIVAFYAREIKPVEIIKSPKAEEIKPAEVKRPEPVRPGFKPEKKPAEVKEVKIGEKAESKEVKKEIKIEEARPAKKDEVRQRVIETNLIQGELVTFFDWRSKIIILIGAVLMPIFVITAVYYGLALYEKSSQAKNLAQAKKFAELEQSIAKEESGIKEILGFQSRLKAVSQIFGQHIYWTNFFKFLEDNTIKDVYFMNFEGDTGGNYAMDALAAGYGSIAEQINVFKSNEKITAVLANGGELVAGDDASQSLVKFILNFTILKSIFTE